MNINDFRPVAPGEQYPLVDGVTLEELADPFDYDLEGQEEIVKFRYWIGTQKYGVIGRTERPKEMARGVRDLVGAPVEWQRLRSRRVHTVPYGTTTARRDTTT